MRSAWYSLEFPETPPYSRLHRVPYTGIRGVDERITATGDVMIATLTVALYVRELATRPAT